MRGLRRALDSIRQNLRHRQRRPPHLPKVNLNRNSRLQVTAVMAPCAALP